MSGYSPLSPTCGYMQPLSLKSVAYTRPDILLLEFERHVVHERCGPTYGPEDWTHGTGFPQIKMVYVISVLNSIDSFVDMPLYLLAVSTLKLPNVIRTKRFKAVQAFMSTGR